MSELCNKHQFQIVRSRFLWGMAEKPTAVFCPNCGETRAFPKPEERVN